MNVEELFDRVAALGSLGSTPECSEVYLLERRELRVPVDVHFHRAGAGADDATRD